MALRLRTAIALAAGALSTALALVTVGCSEAEPADAAASDDLRAPGAQPTCGDLGGLLCDSGSGACQGQGVRTVVNGQLECGLCCGGDAPKHGNLSELSCGRLGGDACQNDHDPGGACGGRGPASLDVNGRVECMHCCGGAVNRNGTQPGGYPTCGDLGGTACDNGDGSCGGGGVTTYLNGRVECQRCCGGSAPGPTPLAASCGQLGGTACQNDHAPGGACGGQGGPSLDIYGRLECLHCCGGTRGGGPNQGPQSDTPTWSLFTEGQCHPNPGLVAQDPNYNLRARGWNAPNPPDGAFFLPPPHFGNADYSAINLSNMWPGRARPPNPFGTQFEVNLHWPAEAGSFPKGEPGGAPTPDRWQQWWRPLASSLRFSPGQDVLLPMTGLPNSSGPGGQGVHPPRYVGEDSQRRPLQAIVVYADPDTVTLQFTLRDGPCGGPGGGYTVYVAGLEVNPGIVRAYNDANARGRGTLPALYPSARLGRARGDVIVALRDTNQWMDPRGKKDWWQDAWDFGIDGAFPAHGD